MLSQIEIELNQSEYELLKENADQYNEEYKDYIDELIYENRIIDKQLEAELFIYTNLNIRVDEFNIEKVKNKIQILKDYITYLEKEVI